MTQAELCEITLKIYAKQMSIAFATWISQEGYRPCDKVFGTFENDSEIEVEFTAEQLYELYLKSKKQ